MRALKLYESILAFDVRGSRVHLHEFPTVLLGFLGSWADCRNHLKRVEEICASIREDWAMLESDFAVFIKTRLLVSRSFCYFVSLSVIN